MAINKPMLPPKQGYVEVEVGGIRTYRNAVTGVLIKNETFVEPETKPEQPVEESSVWAELDAAYQEGVDSV